MCERESVCVQTLRVRSHHTDSSPPETSCIAAEKVFTLHPPHPGVTLTASGPGLYRRVCIMAWKITTWSNEVVYGSVPSSVWADSPRPRLYHASGNSHPDHTAPRKAEETTTNSPQDLTLFGRRGRIAMTCFRQPDWGSGLGLRWRNPNDSRV